MQDHPDLPLDPCPNDPDFGLGGTDWLVMGSVQEVQALRYDALLRLVHKLPILKLG